MIWESIKFFVGLLGALLTAHTAILGFVWTSMDKPTVTILGHNLNPLGIILMVFPAAMIRLSTFALEDLKMRWMRFLLVTTHLNKLEDLLGIHTCELTGKLNFWNDVFLFPDYRDNLIQFDNSQGFRKQNMAGKNTYTLMKKVYLTMIVIAVIFVIFDAALFVLK